MINEPTAMARNSVLELMPLLSIIAERSATTALATALELPLRDGKVALGPFSTACTFYGLVPGFTLKDTRARTNVPAATILEDLSLVASVSAQTSTRTTHSISVRALALMLGLLQSFAGQKIILGVELNWNPDEWLTSMLSSVEGEVCFLPSQVVDGGSIISRSMLPLWGSTEWYPWSSPCKRHLA